MKYFIASKSIIKLLVLLMVFSWNQVQSQGKTHNFLIGYGAVLDSFTTHSYGRLLFDNNSVTVVGENRKMAFRAAQGNISDENGNLLISTNGCWIADANADSMLRVWTYKIDFINQTINNLKVQQEASINDNLANAELKNDYVVNAELPEMNTAFMNEVEINYIERGNDIQYLIDNFSDILAIAQQCPYAGGNAVIRARVWLSMINDSIDYNDNAICLQSGIYRIANIDIKSDKTNDEIIIQPNPAGDYITVTTKSVSSENCKLEIINNLNQVVLAKQLACNNQEKIDVSKINQGLYAVKIFLNNGLTKIQKLIITR